MAYSNNDSPTHAEKVVIVTGPTFGAALSFMLLGAAIGAAGALYLTGGKGGSHGAAPQDAVLEGLSGGGAKEAAQAKQFMTRLNSLAKRVKNLAGKAGETAKAASETIGPVLGDALSEAKRAAKETSHGLEEDINRGPELSSDEPEQV